MSVVFDKQNQGLEISSKDSLVQSVDNYDWSVLGQKVEQKLYWCIRTATMHLGRAFGITWGTFMPMVAQPSETLPLFMVA